jgi:hypothetical protein
MINEKWEKITSETINILLTRDMIRSYASSIHLEEAIYFDIEEAQKDGFQDIPAPPTLPIIFWQHIDVPWLKDAGTILHGKQRFQTNEALIANRSYECVVMLKQISTKKTKNCLMQLSDHELIIKYKGCVHATALSTLIILEK